MTEDISRLVWGAFMPGVCTSVPEPWIAHALARGVTAVCLFGDAAGTLDTTRSTVRRLRALSPAVLVAADEEGGEVTRLQARSGSSFPSPAALGVIDDEAVTRATGRLIGRMLGGAGVDWTLAPSADVGTTMGSPVMSLRSFGNDPQRVAAHASALIQGLQSTGALATAKHFPGHGGTHDDSHEALPTLRATREELDRHDLMPFRSCIGAGVASVMTGHLLVPDIDDAAPASLSRALTTHLLRDALGFRGVVVTDAIGMASSAGSSGSHLAGAVVAALRAGADLVCLGADDQERVIRLAARAVFEALDDGTLEATTLVAAAARRAQLVASRPRPTASTSTQADEHLVAEAAASSLVVSGDPRLTSDGVDVMRFSAAAGFITGELPWGVGRHLRALGLDVREAHSAPDSGGRGLVVEVRDAWRSAELTRALAEVLAARPDAVVVDVGVPTRSLPPCRGAVITQGTGNLATALAAARLAGCDSRSMALAILREASCDDSRVRARRDSNP